MPALRRNLCKGSRPAIIDRAIWRREHFLVSGEIGQKRDGRLRNVMLNALCVRFGGFSWNADGLKNLDHEPMARGGPRLGRLRSGKCLCTPRRGYACLLEPRNSLDDRGVRHARPGGLIEQQIGAFEPNANRPLGNLRRRFRGFRYVV